MGWRALICASTYLWWPLLAVARGPGRNCLRPDRGCNGGCALIQGLVMLWLRPERGRNSDCAQVWPWLPLGRLGSSGRIGRVTTKLCRPRIFYLNELERTSEKKDLLAFF